MNLKKRLTCFLIMLLLACLLCACGSPEPQNWIPVRGEAAGTTSAAASRTDPEASAEAPESTRIPETETAADASASAAATEAPAAPQTTDAEPLSSKETEPAASTDAEKTTAAPDTEAPAETVPDRSSPESTEAPEGEAQVHYIANTNTKKFHLPSCSSVTDMKESNKWYFTGTRDELIAQGYEPCKRCKP